MSTPPSPSEEFSSSSQQDDEQDDRPPQMLTNEAVENTATTTTTTTTTTTEMTTEPETGYHMRERAVATIESIIAGSYDEEAQNSLPHTNTDTADSSIESFLLGLDIVEEKDDGAESPPLQAQEAASTAAENPSTVIAAIPEGDVAVPSGAEEKDTEKKEDDPLDEEITLGDYTQEEDTAEATDEIGLVEKDADDLPAYYHPSRVFKDHDQVGDDAPTIMEDSSISSRDSWNEQGPISIFIPNSNNYRNTGEATAATDHDPLLQPNAAAMKEMERDIKRIRMENQATRERSQRNFKLVVIMTIIIMIVATIAIGVGFGVARRRSRNDEDNQSKDLTPTNSRSPITILPNAAPTTAPNQDIDTRPPTSIGPAPTPAAPLPWPLTITGPKSCFETSNSTSANSGTCGNVPCADSVCHLDSSCCSSVNTSEDAVWDDVCVALACNDPVCGTCPLKTTENCTVRGDLRIAIVLDQYPEETSWTVTRVDTGQVIAVGGPYRDRTPSTRVSETVTDLCLDGCYNFTIYDSAGDGICCSYGVGDYRIWFDGGYPLPAVFGNGNFSVPESTTFGDGC